MDQQPLSAQHCAAELKAVDKEIKELNEKILEVSSKDTLTEGDKRRLEKLESQLAKLEKDKEDWSGRLDVAQQANMPASSVMQSPPGLSEFWNEFKTCPSAIQENEVIQLPADVFILGNSSLGSSIFVRPCYPKLLATALSIIETPGTPHLVILGNPGIGKTYFGYVILLHLARSGATVVYESGKERCRYLFTSEGIFEGDQDDFRAYLYRPSTYYIVDAYKPVDVAAKTILLSSLRRDVWYKFSNDHCTLRFMPIWNREEIQLCRQKVYSHLTQEEVGSLFDNWGGIPRWVLENARDTAQQQELDEAIRAVDLNFLTKAIGNAQALDQAAHRLIHLHVEDDFLTKHYLFASEYVTDKVYLQLYENNRAHLIQFLAVSQGVGDVGVLRGVLFERHAHTIISKGGRFRIRKLKEADEGSFGEEPVELPALEQHVFVADAEVQSEGDYYYRPKINNYESVDSFEKPDRLFQMTGARAHPCKQTGVHNVLKLLGNPENPSLYFVVPNDRFKHFKYQKYHDSQQGIMEKPTYLNVKKVKQFVLLMDLK